MIATIRWTSFALFMIIMVALWHTHDRDLATAVLAATAFVLFLVACWTFASRGSWVEDIPPTHPDALGSLDERERRLW